MQWRPHLEPLGVPIWFVNLFFYSCEFSYNKDQIFTNDPESALIWELSEQKIIKNHERPHWFNVDCNAQPCLKEMWYSGKKESIAYWSDEAFFWTEETQFKTRWQAINGALYTCLGHPFSIPIALDPGGKREFLEPDTWVLHLTGNNTCQLKGQIGLGTKTETIDLNLLEVDGLKWFQGGRDKAQEILYLNSKPSSELKDD